MHNRMQLSAALGAAGLLLAAPPAGAKDKTPAAPVQTAVIENSGSTNTEGYKITVSYSGNKYQIAAVSHTGTNRFSDAGNRKPTLKQVRKLFADLAAAGPLTALPATHGVRSVSFGTSTTLTYKGQQSPDLTSARDPRAVALRDDALAFAQTAHVGGPRRPILMRRVPTPPATPPQ